MKRLLVVSVIVLTVLIGLYFFNQYWIHRYDGLIGRQAGIYRLDPDLVWSIIYEETYFSPWKNGKDGEIGLMQITPAVAREWASLNVRWPRVRRACCATQREIFRLAAGISRKSTSCIEMFQSLKRA